MNSNTHYHNFSLRLNAISRFIRNFGIGADVNIPVVQGNSFSFAGSQSVFGGSFDDFESPINDNRYVPQKFDYSFKNSLSGTLFGRVYMTTSLNPYVDVKLSYIELTESFIFKRDEIPAEMDNGNYLPMIGASDINFQLKHKLIVPGFALGMQPHINENLFINFNIGVDFYTFKSDSFTFPILYDFDEYNGIPGVVVLESKAKNTKAGILINFGVGYFF